MMYTHKISGDTMSREDALEMIHQAQRDSDTDEVCGMSDDEALEHAFSEVEQIQGEMDNVQKAIDAER